MKERAILVAAYLCDSEKVREVGGNNRGPWVKKFLALCGLPEGNPWCAAFVNWCFVQAGAVDLPQQPARVYSWWAWALATGRATTKPVRGDVGLWINPDGTGHQFFFLMQIGPVIRTIEGNTTPGTLGNQREGNGCFRRFRVRTKSMKFVSM